MIVDGPGNKSGLRIGDVVISVENDKILDLNQFQRILARRALGDKVKLKIYRRGKGFMFVTIALEETPKTEDLPQERDLI